MAIFAHRGTVNSARKEDPLRARDKARQNGREAFHPWLQEEESDMVLLRINLRERRFINVTAGIYEEAIGTARSGMRQDYLMATARTCWYVVSP